MCRAQAGGEKDRLQTSSDDQSGVFTVTQDSELSIQELGGLTAL